MNRKVLTALISISMISALTMTSFGAETEADEDYLSSISGEYVELFPELSKEEYHEKWLSAVTPVTGEEAAEDTVSMLLGSCMGEIYGEEAVKTYESAPETAVFDCYFLGGVKKFVIDGDQITGLDENGEEVFSHTYKRMDQTSEFEQTYYESSDPDSGEFTYFVFLPDTPDTTYHLEFRYGEDLEGMDQWTEGQYAYWNAAAISADYDEELMTNCIDLFASENLSGDEE